MTSGLTFLMAARQHEIAGLEQLALTSALVSAIGHLVHALQRERGLSSRIAYVLQGLAALPSLRERITASCRAAAAPTTNAWPGCRAASSAAPTAAPACRSCGG